MQKRQHMPRDLNELAHRVVQIATGQAEPEQPKKSLSPIQEAASVMGKKGGVIGGKKRAQHMTDKQLSEAGRKAAKARWNRAKHRTAG